MKLTKKFNILLIQSIEQYVHFCKIEARIKADCPNLPSWLKDKTDEYYQGCKNTSQGTIESILHLHNAYKGYSECKGKTVNDIEYSYNFYIGLHDHYPKE